MKKPYVAEVRLSPGETYWVVKTNDQREWYANTDRYPDEMSAYMRVMEFLTMQEQDDAYQRHPYPG